MKKDTQKENITIDSTVLQLIGDIHSLIYQYINKRVQEGAEDRDIFCEISGVLLSTLIACFSVFTYGVLDKDIGKLVKEYLGWINSTFKTFYKEIRKDINKTISNKEEQGIDLNKKIDLFIKTYKGRGMPLS